MAFPHRLKFVLLLMCCMQHALASNSSTHVKITSTPVTTSSSSTMAVNNTVSIQYSVDTTNSSSTDVKTTSPSVTKSSSMSTISKDVATTSAMASSSNKASKGETYTTETPVTATTKASATSTVEPISTTHDTTKSSSASVKITTSSSMSTIRNASAKAVVNNTASKDGTSTTGTPMTATKKASPTATVQPTSTTHDTTNSSSTDVKTTSPSATTSSSMSTIRNASFSIGTEYSSPDCASCRNGGTITVTMSCSINKDTKCDKDEFNKTSCGYVTMVDKMYRCADVKKNFTYYEKKYLKPVKQCDDVCPATGTASFSIGTEYSSPDCISCSIGGTITVTMSCSIKMLSNDDKKCDKDEFNKTRCGYIILANEEYRCADVKKNFTYYEKKHLKPVKQCGDVCPTSGSVLSAHLVLIFSSGIAVSLLSQTL